MIRHVFLILIFLQVATSCKKEDAGGLFTGYPVIPDLPASNPDSTIYGHYLALGDSYTIGQSVPVEDRYPNQTSALLFKDSIQLQVEIIAQTGWTTANLISRLNLVPPKRLIYDVVTLLIGVNNQYQYRSQIEYSAEFDSLLNRAVAFAGFQKSRVFVLSIPDYGVTPFGKGFGPTRIAMQIDSFNLINKTLTEKAGCNYLDITTSSRRALNDRTLIASDGLHYSGKEYYNWSVLLARMMKQVIQ